MSDESAVDEYLAELPADRRGILGAVRDVINKHLPAGYDESFGFGMITWGVPLQDYPNTYNGEPLGIVALASRKNYMAVYLMGLYGSEDDERWFREQYRQRGIRLDMGKSCVRFRKLEVLPLDVLGAAVGRVTPAQLILRYEAARGRPARQ